MNRLILGFVLLACSIVTNTTSAASTYFELSNHPNGGVAPPLYGLRLDGLFGTGSSEEWTFDFDHADSAMFLVLDDVNDTVRIVGQMYGGRDAGSAYDSNLSGLWEVDYTYDNNVTINNSSSTDPDVEVSMSAGNTGFLAPLFSSSGTVGNGDTVNIVANTNIGLVDQNSNAGFSFRFNNNGHRLAGDTGIVGWGWLNHSGNAHVYASDWLFTGEATLNPPSSVVPIPAAAWLFGSALMGFAGFSRRRVRS